MKRIVILLLVITCFTGCGRGESAATYRVVTGVQVDYTRQGDTIHREYTKPVSMQSILTYLRILNPYGPVYPDGSSDIMCKIVLHYSQGPDSVYIQQGQRFLQKDGGSWENIDPSRASLLYPMLLLLPSDEGN